MFYVKLFTFNDNNYLYIYSFSECYGADHLPVTEGNFVSSQVYCDLLQKGELDFVELSIEQSGCQLSFPEVSCFVAEVKQIRDKRYHVKADCREFEDIYEHQFFLDVLPDNNLRVDGRDLVFCKCDGSVSLL